MNRSEHLLICLAEECAEVAKECTKALRFGLTDEYDGPNVKERLENEIADMFAVICMVQDAGLIDADVMCDTDKHEAKLAKVEKYLAYSATRGTLTGETD